jgi:uncharacterized protein (DUF1810 family)
MSLDRFIQAQESAYPRVLAELKAGKKMSCWIWWIFPQEPMAGTSGNSMFYAMLEDEARDYLMHPLLGPRYRECVAVAHGHVCREGVEPVELMSGSLDVLKLGSSLELFLKVSCPTDEPFRTEASELLAAIRRVA